MRPIIQFYGTLYDSALNANLTRTTAELKGLLARGGFVNGDGSNRDLLPEKVPLQVTGQACWRSCA
jgi:hypothetical protein